MIASNLLGSAVDKEKTFLENLQMGAINLGSNFHP